jgi:hypothetical protein
MQAFADKLQNAVKGENPEPYITPGNSGDCTSPGPTGYCSESFSIYSYTCESGSCCAPGPGSLILLGTGLIGAAGFFRRRLGF